MRSHFSAHYNYLSRRQALVLVSPILSNKCSASTSGIYEHLHVFSKSNLHFVQLFVTSGLRNLISNWKCSLLPIKAKSNVKNSQEFWTAETPSSFWLKTPITNDGQMEISFVEMDRISGTRKNFSLCSDGDIVQQPLKTKLQQHQNFIAIS